MWMHCTIHVFLFLGGSVLTGQPLEPAKTPQQPPRTPHRSCAPATLERGQGLCSGSHPHAVGASRQPLSHSMRLQKKHVSPLLCSHAHAISILPPPIGATEDFLTRFDKTSSPQGHLSAVRGASPGETGRPHAGVLRHARSLLPQSLRPETRSPAARAISPGNSRCGLWLAPHCPGTASGSYSGGNQGTGARGRSSQPSGGQTQGRGENPSVRNAKQAREKAEERLQALLEEVCEAEEKQRKAEVLLDAKEAVASFQNDMLAKRQQTNHCQTSWKLRFTILLSRFPQTSWALPKIFKTRYRADATPLALPTLRLCSLPLQLCPQPLQACQSRCKLSKMLWRPPLQMRPQSILQISMPSLPTSTISLVTMQQRSHQWDEAPHTPMANKYRSLVAAYCSLPSPVYLRVWGQRF